MNKLGKMQQKNSEKILQNLSQDSPSTKEFSYFDLYLASLQYRLDNS